MLTDNDIEKFQTLYREQFGVEISKEKALEQSLKLLTLMSNVYKPMTRDEAYFTDSHRHNAKQDLVDRLDMSQSK